MTTTPDPRPGVTTSGEGTVLHGWRCTECRMPSLWATPRCAVCGGGVIADRFGPRGTVWSSTVVRVPVPGRTPPYAMAYVDLDDGPRVLAHVAGPPERLGVGARVILAPKGTEGDVMVEEVA